MLFVQVAPQLYYLKQLRRARLPSLLLTYCISMYLRVIRPVLEYGCAVWHHGLTVAQSQKLESLQKRALRIIHQIVHESRMILRVYTCMLEYNPSLLGGLNWGGGSFSRSQYPTVAYMTFFPNDVIQKFSPDFDDTLPIHYQEPKLIKIILLYIMPWLNTNNLIK